MESKTFKNVMSRIRVLMKGEIEKELLDLINGQFEGRDSYSEMSVRLAGSCMDHFESITGFDFSSGTNESDDLDDQISIELFEWLGELQNEMTVVIKNWK